MDNDAVLAAVAEGALGCSNYVALLAGARLGAGVVIDGRLLRGVLGEMGTLDHVAGVGSAVGLGARVAQWARQAVTQPKMSPDGPLATPRPDEIDGKFVQDLAAGGDPDALQIIDRAGQVLARVAGVLASMFDPQLIIVAEAITDRHRPTDPSWSCTPSA